MWISKKEAVEWGTAASRLILKDRGKRDGMNEWNARDAWPARNRDRYEEQRDLTVSIGASDLIH